MHTVLNALPWVVFAAGTGALLYRLATWRTATRIHRTLHTDKVVAMEVLEDLAEHWGVKIVRQETPGGA